MLKRDIRLRKEYLFKKKEEINEKLKYEKKTTFKKFNRKW